MPMGAMIESLLVPAANSTAIDLGKHPEELQLYENDIDLKKLKTQLQMLPRVYILLMLPDLVKTRNVKVPNCIPIKSVTNVRTLFDIMNEIDISMKMLSEVLKPLKIFYDTRHNFIR